MPVRGDLTMVIRYLKVRYGACVGILPLCVTYRLMCGLVLMRCWATLLIRCGSLLAVIMCDLVSIRWNFRRLSVRLRLTSELTSRRWLAKVVLLWPVRNRQFVHSVNSISIYYPTLFR